VRGYSSVFGPVHIIRGKHGTAEAPACSVLEINCCPKGAMAAQKRES